jgi:hypothetical protein
LRNSSLVGEISRDCHSKDGDSYESHQNPASEKKGRPPIDVGRSIGCRIHVIGECLLSCRRFTGSPSRGTCNNYRSDRIGCVLGVPVAPTPTR